jgi:hypothetical protein
VPYFWIDPGPLNPARFGPATDADVLYKSILDLHGWVELI